MSASSSASYSSSTRRIMVLTLLGQLRFRLKCDCVNGSVADARSDWLVIYCTKLPYRLETQNYSQPHGRRRRPPSFHTLVYDPAFHHAAFHTYGDDVM